MEEIKIFIEQLVQLTGMTGSASGVVTHILLIIVVAFLSWLSGYLCRKVLMPAVLKLTSRTEVTWDDKVFNATVLTSACHIVPAIVVWQLLPLVFSQNIIVNELLKRATAIYIVIMSVRTMVVFIDSIKQIESEKYVSLQQYMRSFCGVFKIILVFVAVIIVVAIIIDKSPLNLFAGLGATSAILMLVFKDTIEGLVAGIRLTSNDMLHKGDWITVPSTNANGTVQEVSLVAVKVLNWDKTTTTLPPYSLISSGFTNYRTMQQSHTRRIRRSFMIDADSVLPATPEMLDMIRKVPFMDEYITKKLAQQAAGDVHDVDNPEGLVNGTIDTNLGLFRAYMKMWLDANPDISHTSDCFVSTLPQTATGIPLQIYCFTATSGWFPYEGIQDTVFEHVAAMLRFFMLYTFENPSGRDTIVDGYLSPGGDIDDIYGIPYPFFQNPAAPDSPASTRVTPKRPPRNAPSPQPQQPQQPQQPK